MKLTCAEDYLVGGFWDDESEDKRNWRAVVAAGYLMAEGRTLDETAEIMGALRHQAAALRVLSREKFGWCCRGPFPYGRKRLRQLDAIYDNFVLRADIALASAPAYLFEKRRAMTPDISWVYTANACWHLVYIVGWGEWEMPFEWNTTTEDVALMLKIAGDNLTEGNRRKDWVAPRGNEYWAEKAKVKRERLETAR